jgi:hypothetical protein
MVKNAELRMWIDLSKDTRYGDLDIDLWLIIKVIKSNFNVGHIYYTLLGKAFTFGMWIFCGETIIWTPKSVTKGH